MKRRPPWTLWKSLLIEQWRLILLTTGVVVTVISFAAAVNPLADGKLDPLDAPLFIGLAMVPMLAYAIPFAACFSAAMVYHRLVQDNEATGMHAAGISHRSVIAPSLLTGIVLAGVLWGLNDRVIPRFLRQMQRLVTSDAVRLIARAVETGQALRLGEWVVTADRVYVLPDPPQGVQAQAHLKQVAAVKLGPSDNPDLLNIRAEGTAASADIWLLGGEDGGDGESIPFIRLGDAVYRNEGEVHLGFVDSADITPPPLTGSFSDDPEFLTSAEMAELRENPEQMEFIAYRKRHLAVKLAEPDTIEAIKDDLVSVRRFKMVDQLGRFTYYIFGADLRQTPDGWLIVPAPNEQVRIEEYAEGQRSGGLRRWRCNRAILNPKFEGGERDPHLRFTLTCRRVVSEDPGSPGERQELQFANLEFSQDLTAILYAKPIDELAALARSRIVAKEPGSERLIRPRGDLLARLKRMHREVIAKVNERAALSVAGALMVVTGAIAALRLRDSIPLAVYLASFLPALLTLVLINGGSQFTHRTGTAGLIILWLGVALPALGVLWAYQGLKKH